MREREDRLYHILVKDRSLDPDMRYHFLKRSDLRLKRFESQETIKDYDRKVQKFILED